MAGSAVFNGTTSTARYAHGSDLFAALPVTLACWMNTTTNQVQDCVGVADASVDIRLLALRQTSLAASSRTAGVTNVGGALSVGGVWQSMVCSFYAGGQTVWINGSATSDGTALSLPATMRRIAVGCSAQLTNFFWGGNIAHASIHAAQFTNLDATHHAAGWAANRLPSCFAWYPLESNGNDVIGGKTLTLANVSFAGTGPVIDYGNDWTAAMRNPDRTPDSTPQDRQRLLRRKN